ncbi:hypothetical protein Taro_030836 [Colocasia esculenta]|uniref:Protein TIFY n=1 Tax=Colocasia esculenta TaxID=4460 RepID=A0A843VHC2_COLES|nr:hypothetical protein [Colocasia esculenta]
MSKAYVEIDFFQMEKLNNSSSRSSSPELAPSSFRGIQSVVSRINPQLLKTVMAAEQSRSSDSPTSSNPPSPSRATSPPLLPAHKPSSRGSSPDPDTAPLTIFYHGNVITVNVPRHKAEDIMRMAETGVDRTEEALQQLGGNQLDGDLPIARKKSLHRFLEKRKERLMSASPYHKFMASCPC